MSAKLTNAADKAIDWVVDAAIELDSQRTYGRSALQLSLQLEVLQRKVDAAREEIQRWSGRQFDPEIVKTFMSMDKNIWTDLRNEIEAQIHRFAYSVKSSS